MRKRKRWGVPAALLVVASAGLLAGPTALAALDDPSTDIPDSVLLQPEDLGGVQPAEGGPDQAIHPLPPRPCADASIAEPLAARMRYATVGGRLMYEYVGRYAPGTAAQVAEDLRAAVKRCPDGPGDVRYRIASTDMWGPHSTLLWRDWDSTDHMDAYLVGVAADFLVVVVDTGDGATRPGDLTHASSVGSAAIRRAGGETTSAPVPAPTQNTSAPVSPAPVSPVPVSPVPAGSAPANSASANSAPGTRWVTFEAEVTGVHRTADSRTATVDLRVPAGTTDCVREPRATNLTEENGRVYATFVADTFENEEFTRCVERTAAKAEVIADTPLGDRLLVLNQQAWAPAGDGYRRCDARLGCTPPADHCDQVWIRASVDDIPQHAYWDLRGCDGEWAVLDINTSAGDCGPVDPGPRPGCTTTARWQRHFMRFENAWVTISGARRAGCAGVHAVEPDFPVALCRDLPAR